MNKLNRVMLMLIAMAAIMLLAVGIDKGLQRHERKMWEIEREAVYEEARADIASMQANIQTLSEDPEALISYIEENELNYTEKKEVFLPILQPLQPQTVSTKKLRKKKVTSPSQQLTKNHLFFFWTDFKYGTKMEQISPNHSLPS